MCGFKPECTPHHLSLSILTEVHISVCMRFGLTKAIALGLLCMTPHCQGLLSSGLDILEDFFLSLCGGEASVSSN